jgi:TRAP-type C4-dicarboxylate transport system permease small subunit
MFLFDKLPRLGQRALRVLTNIVGVFTFVYIIPRALVYAVKNYRFVTSIMRIPMTHLYLVLTVGGILTVVHLLLDTILAFGRDQIPEESAL